MLLGEAVDTSPSRLFGSPKRKNPTKLDFTEKERIKGAIEDEVLRLKLKVEKKFSPQKCHVPILDDNLNELRSEIMKRFTFAKEKRKAIQNVVRIERENIRHDREKVGDIFKYSFL